MIVGLTGLARSGKDAVAELLIGKYAFKHLDFYRDILLVEAAKRGIETKDKMAMSILGDELREEGGRGVLGKRMVKLIEPDVDYVITGFRSPEEVDYVRNESDGDFYLLYVHANKLMRFSRRKEIDPRTMEEFEARDMRDINNKGLGKVLEMADFKISNEGTLEELFKTINELMEKLR